MENDIKYYAATMKIHLVLIVLVYLNLSACNQKESESPADYVNPFIGTAYFGHTFPGATLPFAMVQLSPDTDTEGWTYASGYRYADKSIMGFTHTHYSGVGWNKLGDILIMPTVNDEIQVDPGTRENPDAGYRSRFEHSDEKASPGYYAVKLKDYNIFAELTATKRVGLHKYTFPDAENAHILIDLGHSIGALSEKNSHISVVSNTRIEGYKSSSFGKLYFVALFSKPFSSFGTWNNSYKKPESGGGFINPYKTDETGKRVGVFLDYSTSKDEAIYVKVSISYVSIEGAEKNLEAELPHWDFLKVQKQAINNWNEVLSKIEIEGGSQKQKKIFYSSLYHSLLAQQISNDVDGRYYGMDNSIHKAEDHDFYPTFFAWDTYRSEHPLMTLIEPRRTNDMMKSIVAKTVNYGWLPAQHAGNVFGQGMVGDHLVPIVTDAYIKGIRDYDIESVYNLMRKKATELAAEPINSKYSRPGLQYFMKLGYLPADRETESVPATMEMSYDDWCLAQLAKELGKEEDYQLFSKRAGNYRNVYDKGSGFMRPRMLDGSWLQMCEKEDKHEITKEGNHSYYTCFDPLLIGVRPNRHFTESNAWQYIWSVQHDVGGLIDLMGGRDDFIAKLDTFFSMSSEVSGPNYVGVVGTIGQYIHGNQPSHHVAYLYNYVGAAWKTQEKVHKIMDMLYHDKPGGICGNDDMGSLSSWYVLSAMGFYPVTPGQDIYVIGTPLFNSAKINLENGNQFIIEAKNRSEENIYIRAATLNGEKYSKLYLKHSDIVKGGKLVFEMSSKPEKNWGNAESDRPYSNN